MRVGVLICFLSFATVAMAQTTGPQKGWLIIHGGGSVSKEIIERFVLLAGGPNANVVLIPTALPDEDIEKGGFLRGHGRGWAQSWGMNHGCGVVEGGERRAYP